jgi:hypothetical protein
MRLKVISVSSSDTQLLQQIGKPGRSPLVIEAESDRDCRQLPGQPGI